MACSLLTGLPKIVKQNMLEIDDLEQRIKKVTDILTEKIEVTNNIN